MRNAIPGPAESRTAWPRAARLALYLAAALIVILGFIQAKRDRISGEPYIYDEADYMYAVSFGWLANAFDSPSRPVSEFIGIGLAAVRGQGPTTSLSQIARSGADVNFYRHTHGPFYHYWLMLASRWARTERDFRLWSLVFPLLTGVLIAAGCRAVLPSPAGPVAALLGAGLYLWSPAVVATGELVPVLAFSLCVLASLFPAVLAVQTGNRKFWWAAMIAAGLAFATLEVALVLVLTLVIVAWRERRSLDADWKFALRSAAVFAGTVLVVWPAAILKLAFLKAYLFMAYLAVARKASWGDASLAGTWLNRFWLSPVEWLLIAAAMLWYCFRGGRPRQAFPFLLFGALMIAATFNVKTATLRYAIPFLPVLHVFAGLGLAQWLATRRPALMWTAAAACVALLGVNLVRFELLQPWRPDPRTPAVLESIRRQGLGDKRLLLPQGYLPTVHFYFPAATLEGFSDSGALGQKSAAGGYDALLRPEGLAFEPLAP